VSGTAARPETLLFLPGAGGSREFWQPVAARVAFPGRVVHVGWPGFAGTPSDPRVRGFDDLADLVLAEIPGPCAIVAQSMGGVIAVQVAARRPDLITHLVLTATSGGVPLDDLGVEDWRPAFLREFPAVPRWFVDAAVDLRGVLASLQPPVLLVWGDADPISPIGVGRRLAGLLGRATLHVVAGGHDVAHANPDPVAAHLAAFLGLRPAAGPGGAAGAVAIRAATPADAAAIAAVHLASWRATYVAELSAAFRARQDSGAWTAMWRQRLVDRDPSTLVAERDGRVVGILAAGPSRDRDTAADTWEIVNLHVAPAEHGRGIGRRLFDAAVAAARAAGAVELTLWVVDTNARARRFYEGRGMHADGARQQHPVEDERLREVRYRRRL
jgi:pimeloyl-ACP methyl ester carboxylesterase/ribosomal protein S18 acetylase RimI-like enzyme